MAVAVVIAVARRICPLAILRCSISIQVFILMTIFFLYFSGCLSYSCYYYLLAIIDTMYILLLFVSMWAPPPSPPSLIVRIVDDICVHNISFIAARNHAVSCAAVVSIFVASFLLHFASLSSEQVKRGKSTAENRFVISSLFFAVASLFIHHHLCVFDRFDFMLRTHTHSLVMSNRRR